MALAKGTGTGALIQALTEAGWTEAEASRLVSEISSEVDHERNWSRSLELITSMEQRADQQGLSMGSYIHEQGLRQDAAFHNRIVVTVRIACVVLCLISFLAGWGIYASI